jgi:hypothetical protein
LEMLVVGFKACLMRTKEESAPPLPLDGFI